MPVSKVALLGSKIQYLTANIQHSIETEDSYSDAEDELLDALEDLHTELVGPMKFLGTFFAPPDFSAMQVAYEYEIFQYVPTQPLNGGKPGPYPAISSKDLAAQVGMDEAFLVRIMRLLAANKIFSEVDDRVFAHTKLSAGMAEELVAAHLGGLLNDVYKASTSLTDTIKGGYSSAWEARFGMPMYEYFEKNLSKDRIRMAKSMAVSSQEELKELAVIFPWKDFRKVVDIGGGVGHLATYLAQQHPHLQTVNQDLPLVFQDAVAQLAALPRSQKSAHDRITFEAYDYYTPQPRTDADAFILRRCLHNNSDPECVRILKAVVPGLEAGGDGARLLIIEKLLPRWDEYKCRHKTKSLRREDVVMMISVGGKERTLDEFGGLVREADGRFEIDKVYPARDHFAVVSVKLGTAKPSDLNGH